MEIFLFSNDITTALHQFIQPLTPNWAELRVILSFGAALLAAYLFNRLLEHLAPKIAGRINDSLGGNPHSDRFVRTRRLETFFSLSFAISRVVVIIWALGIAWRLSNPATAPIALVGASTVFLLLASATLVPLLKDITYGFIMIAEQWYNVGDHIVIEPFPHLGGIVEHVTMRSTKLRSMNGEIIWVHNQHIQAVRVSAAASHTMAIETFVSDPALGQKVVKDALRVMPRSPITIPKPLAITEVKQIDTELWRITAICEVTPYREWIIDQFALDAIKTTDRRTGREPVIVHGPVAYYADVTAEKRFRRSVNSRASRSKPAARHVPADSKAL